MQKQNTNGKQFAVVALMIAIAASTRFLMIPNFTAVSAMCLFGAAYFQRKYWAFVVPFAAMFLSDLLLNNSIYANMYPEYYDGFVLFAPGSQWTYLAFGFVVLLGMGWFREVNPARLFGASVSASLVFFLVSNFGVWASGTMYGKDFPGLVSCYVAGIPFLQPTLLGDLFYSFLLFGLYEFAVKPRLNAQAA